MKRKTLITYLLLALFSLALFSQPLAETQYASLAAEILPLSEAQNRYDSLAAAVAKERSEALSALAEAQERGDRAAYNEAQQTLKNLATYRMSEEQSLALQKEILALKEPERSEYALWLTSQSPYYRPTLTLDFFSESEGYRYSYQQSITKDAGSTLTLPASEEIRFNTEYLGLLARWESRDGKLRYSEGEMIRMPAVNTTLVAVYEEGIRFFDARSGIDERYTLGEVVAPTPEAEDGARFVGWVDRTTGRTALAGDSVTPQGKGAFFEGVYKDVTIEEVRLIRSSHFGRRGREFSLSFSYQNSGDVHLRGLTASLYSESEYVKVLSPAQSLGSLNPGYWGSGDSRFGSRMRGRIAGFGNNLRFIIDPAAPKGTELTLTVAITDESGERWAKEITLVVE